MRRVASTLTPVLLLIFLFALVSDSQQAGVLCEPEVKAAGSDSGAEAWNLESFRPPRPPKSFPAWYEAADASRILPSWPGRTARYALENAPQLLLADFAQRRRTDRRTSDFGYEEWTQQVWSDHDSAELVIGIENPGSDHSQSLASLVAGYGGKIVDTISFGDMKVVVADVPFSEMSSFVSEVEGEQWARYVEPNVVFEANLVPSDPGWSAQWGPRRIEADYAWNTTTGGEIIVAVVDTGIDYTHPDLAPNYVALGFDWVYNDTDPRDDHGHGTHCAGIIGAVLSNDVGIAGVSQVRIMAEKFLDRRGRGSSSKAAKAVIHAVDQGARIISCSFGGSTSCGIFHAAAQYAWDHGALIVAAAGNNGWDQPHYPSSFPEVVSVAATDQTDACALWSNWGETIEVAAPGVEIYSTTPTYPAAAPIEEDYDNASGTSMACPHVAGVAALIWSQFPNYSNQEVRAQLRLTAQDLGDPGFDVHYGYGRVNARRAVEGLQDHDLYLYGLETPRALQPNTDGVINATVINCGRSREANVTIEFYANGTRFDSVVISSVEALGGRALVNVRWWAPPLEGVYEITVHIVPVAGETITWDNEASNTVLVRNPQVFRVPQDYPTIKGAVKATLPLGDTILVAPGTYYECFTVKSDYLTIIGEDPETTIIDANYSTYILYEDSPQNINFFDVPAVKVDADYVSISNLTIRRGTAGMRLWEVRGCRLRNLTFTDNIHTFGVFASNLYGYLHDVDTSNTIDGKPIYFWINEHNRRAPQDAGFFAAVACTNITLTDMVLTNNIQGALFAFSHDITIEGVTAETNVLALYLDNSRRVVITDNTIKNSSSAGIWLDETEESTITSNRIENNLGLHDVTFGVYLLLSNPVSIVNNTVLLLNRWPQGYMGIGYAAVGVGIWNGGSDNCVIANNTIAGTGGTMLDPDYQPNVAEDGIMMWGTRDNVVEDNVLTNLSDWGIQIDDDIWIGGESIFRGFSNNVIRRNNITNVICMHPQYPWISVGNAIWGILTENNTFCENTIQNCLLAFWLRFPDELQVPNRFYHNNFLDIREDAWDAPPWGFPWDDGYPSGGNYWSWHIGADLFSGPHQNRSGSDGIIDLPYVRPCWIDGVEVNVTIDPYPLATPWTPPDVAVTDVTLYEAMGVSGFVAAVDVTVENQKAKAESVTITLYADEDPAVIGDEITIGTHVVPYLSGTSSMHGTSATVAFAWNTTNVPKGDYTIAAIATVESDVDMTNNTALAEGTVTVLTAGHDVAIQSVTLSQTVVGQNSSTSINITAKNYGSFVETFNVTLYANATTISAYEGLTLVSGGAITLAQVLNTMGFAKGYYSLTVCVTPVVNETVVADNVCSQLVCVTIPGDVDGSWAVNIYDIVLMANAYDTHDGDPRFLANADLDCDRDIDIYDIVIACSNYGEGW